LDVIASTGEQVSIGLLALALQALRFAGRLGPDDGSVAIRLGTDAARRLLAGSAGLGSHQLPRGLHTLIDRLAVRRRQVGVADFDVDHLQAETLGFVIDLVTDLSHQLGAPVADDLDESRVAKHAPDGRVEHDAEARLGHRNRPDRLKEKQRIDDAIATERVDHQAPLIRGDDLERRGIEVEDALLEIDHVVDQRQLIVDARLIFARLIDRANRIAKAQDQRLLGLVDDENAEIERDADRDDDGEAKPTEDAASHWLPPDPAVRDAPAPDAGAPGKATPGGPFGRGVCVGAPSGK